jgi:hypothetical protein
MKTTYISGSRPSFWLPGGRRGGCALRGWLVGVVVAQSATLDGDTCGGCWVLGKTAGMVLPWEGACETTRRGPGEGGMDHGPMDFSGRCSTYLQHGRYHGGGNYHAVPESHMRNLQSED